MSTNKGKKLMTGWEKYHRLREFAKIRREGNTIPQTAKIMGVTLATAKWYSELANKSGYFSPRVATDRVEVDIDKIREMRTVKITPRVIAEELGVSLTTIRRRMSENGIY